MTTVLASTWTDIDYPVGRTNGVFIVFDNDQRVTQVAKTHQRFNQAPIVALVQADGWLIKHIQNPYQSRANLGRQPNALRLTTGQCSGRAVK